MSPGHLPSHDYFAEIYSGLIEVFAVQLIHILIIYGMYGRGQYKRVILPLIGLWVVTTAAALATYSKVTWVKADSK